MKKLVKQLRRAMLLGLSVCLICALSPFVALAEHSQPGPPEPRSDGVGYLLVLFCVALSVIILCRTSNRNPEARLEKLEED